MATSNTTTNLPTTDAGDSPDVEWNQFAYESYTRIVSRKHGLAVPSVDFRALTSSEQERRLRLLQELAHLPPA